MDLVVDIGGVFILSNDPGRLAEWYREHLGIECQQSEFGYHRDFTHQDPPRAGRHANSLGHSSAQVACSQRRPFI